LAISSCNPERCRANAALSWKSHGALSPARDNVIVYPTSYTAKHTDQEWLIAQDKILDPTRWFIFTPDMFRQRPVIESQQHAGLSAPRYLARQRPRAAAPAHRAVRRRPDSLLNTTGALRLVHGGQRANKVGPFERHGEEEP
jgi:hypothetical protein